MTCLLLAPSIMSFAFLAAGTGAKAEIAVTLDVLGSNITVDIDVETHTPVPASGDVLVPAQPFEGRPPFSGDVFSELDDPDGC
ncbi:MAG: hypothetical protein H6898_11865 [Rhodobacter sp.]|nr:hypothetical protein [Rhodobacter sp.]